MCHDFGDPVPSHMDSKLILQLVPGMVKKVMLWNPACLAAPGMARFVASCTSLQEMHITANSMLACSQADACLVGCCGLRILLCNGLFSPQVLPHSLQALEVDLTAWSEIAKGGMCPEQWTEALLFRIAFLPALDTLKIQLGTVPHLPAMPGVSWRRIRILSVNFDMEDDIPIDLGWLRDQRADRLQLSIGMHTGEHYSHKTLVQELSSITVHSLTFNVETEIEAQSQLLWTTVTALTTCDISIRVQTMNLHWLPHCKNLSVRLGWSNGQYQIFWHAVSAHPGRVQVCGCSFEVVGFPGSVPEHTEPWRLELEAPVPGIQAAFLQRGKDDDAYILQNPAADAAGWNAGCI